MRCFRRAICGVIRRDLGLPSGGVVHVDCAVEQGKRRKGLIVWNFVARLIYSCEREITVFSRLTVLDAINHHGRIPRSSEFLCTGKVGS